jgi:hypothetical protein
MRLHNWRLGPRRIATNGELQTIPASDVTESPVRVVQPASRPDIGRSKPNKPQCDIIPNQTVPL